VVNELEPAPPAPARGAAQGLLFRLLGFPIRIDPSFLLIVALIGFDGSASRLAVWVGLAVVSVLAHELGHALAARRMGATASISLQGMGGLTRSSRAEPFSRGESALLSAAGPAAGILIGLPVLYAIAALDWPSWTMGGFALRTAAFTTLGWSALNLLPIVPLDGGRAVAALHPAFWLVGLAGLVVLMILAPNPILILILVIGGMELWNRWRHRGTEEARAYYSISRGQRVAVAVVYLGLSAFLVLAMGATHIERDL
jgi:Zn-dependent protease